MFREDRDTSDIAIGLIVVAIVAAGLFAIRHDREPASIDESKPPDVASIPEPAVHEPVSERIGYPRPRASSVIATAYECVTADGQRVLSDRPCGADAVVREIAAPNRMPAQDTSNLYRAPARTRDVYRRPSQRTPASGGSATDNSAICDSIQTRIDAINARMRQKYTGQEGERFRKQLRALSEDRWEAGCGKAE